MLLGVGPDLLSPVARGLPPEAGLALGRGVSKNIGNLKHGVLRFFGLINPHSFIHPQLVVKEV